MSSRVRWVIVSTLSLLPLLGWWSYGLFDIDEGSYAAVVAEMNRRGEWITPFYNGKPWFEKPILLYWLAKPAMLLCGDDFGPRLPSVLTALATYAVVAWFTNRRFGEKTAQLATLMLAGSLLMITYGRMMMTDMPLVLCLTAAMATFWESLEGNSRWRIATAGLLGLGVLAKGPVALILFAIVAGWTFWREPQMRPKFRGYWLPGTALLAAVIATWYLPAYLENGQLFVRKFLIEQNVGRFTGGDAAHTIPGIGGFATGLAMYLGVLLLGMLPWSLFTWQSLRQGRRTDKPDERALERYLATWALTVFIFFAISGAKLPHYILPMAPPLAILVAAYAVRFGKRPKYWFAVAAGSCVLMAIVANVAFLWWFKASGQKEVQAIAAYVRKEGGSVAIYQMSRREADLGTGTTNLRETNLPSLLMYLHQNALETDDLRQILRPPAPIWIITREGRIHPEDFIAAERAGRKLVEVKPPVEEVGYRLYRVLER